MKCVDCGKEFTTFRYNSVRCDDCLEVVRKKARDPFIKNCIFCHRIPKDIDERSRFGVHAIFCDSLCERHYYEIRNRIVRTFDGSELNEELAKLKELGKDYQHEKIPKMEGFLLGV